MLRPREIEQLPEAMVSLYAEVEQDILADMARRISTYNYWIPAADHQYRRLIEMGNFHSHVMQALSSRTGKTQNELARLMRQAGSKALAFDTRIYQRHGLKPPPLAASPGLQRILQTGLAQTNGLFRNLTGTTASTATGQFAHALDRAWLQIHSGAFDRKTAVHMAVKALAQQGVGAIRYPSGKVDTLEVAVRRAVVTGVNQTTLKMQWQLAGEMGCDLVEVTAHAGARPAHAAWQGGIYSRSGQSAKYPDFVFSTGYGSGAGLGGWNCRHSFFPYFEGSPRAYSPEMLEEYARKTRKYNGKALTEYEAAQQQRHIERQIRRWKREHAAMQAAGQDTAEAAAKIRKWQGAQRDFLRQTGLKRQSDREQIAGWGKKQAAAARAESARKVLTNANGRRIIIVTKTRITGEPGTITQIQNAKGGIDRNYYGAAGLQIKQISNNGHGHKKEEAMGVHGEHAHDYFINEKGYPQHGPARELTDQEREENGDIL